MMFDWLTLHVGALVITGTLFGVMAGFAFVFAPLVFRYIEREDAANLMRRIFPVYDRALAVIAVVPAICLLPGGSYGFEIVTMLTVAGVFIFAARLLIPAMERARASGDEARRRRLHRASVFLHAVQMAAVLVVFVRLAG